MGNVDNFKILQISDIKIYFFRTKRLERIHVLAETNSNLLFTSRSLVENNFAVTYIVRILFLSTITRPYANTYFPRSSDAWYVERATLQELVLHRFHDCKHCKTVTGRSFTVSCAPNLRGYQHWRVTGFAGFAFKRNTVRIFYRTLFFCWINLISDGVLFTFQITKLSDDKENIYMKGYDHWDY